MPSVLEDASLSTNEKLILMKGSKLYDGHPFWPWDKDPSAAEYDNANGSAFTDDFKYKLSGLQSDILTGWQRPAAIDAAAWRATLNGKLDLVQDVTNDCSIVASLCVANARAARVISSSSSSCSSSGSGSGSGSKSSSSSTASAAAAAAAAKTANVFSRTLFPFERASRSGKYVVKLQFNGCWRRVAIDDQLPVSRGSGQTLHVAARDDGDGAVLWPALVEKALLKVMGGYDFPGSDSANDLWMLAGWIPERVPLGDGGSYYGGGNGGSYSGNVNSLGPDELWRRVATAFRYGDVMLTLGTPKLSLLEENVYGLASGHDYAVIDIKEKTRRVDDEDDDDESDSGEEGGRKKHRMKRRLKKKKKKKIERGEPTNGSDKVDGEDDEEEEEEEEEAAVVVRKLLIKNPWSHASDHLRAAGGGSGQNANAIGLEVIREDDESETETMMDPATATTPVSPTSTEMPGTRWMDLNDVFRRFETMYLSWNPDIFPHRRDAHFSYDLKKKAAGRAFTHCPQYSLRSRKKDCTLWLVLSRHITAASRDVKNPGYICLYAFKSATRVMLNDRAVKNTSYVNSDNVLLQLDLEAETEYVIVVSGQEIPGDVANFTLTAFSTKQLEHFKPAPDKYKHTSLVEGSWSISTAGGNKNSPHFHLNPQFTLTVTQPTDLGLLLWTPKKEYSINVDVVWADGKRIQPGLPSRDIYARSPDYRKASALAEIKGVRPGVYTVVCSTFEAGRRAPFTLQLFATSSTTTTGVALKPAPSDDAGMFRHAFMPVDFRQGVDRILCPLKVAHTCRLRVKAQRAAKSVAHSPLRVLLEYGQGPDTQVLASSGEPRSDSAALTLNDVLVQTGWCVPPSPGVWLVVERVGGAFVEQIEKVFVEVLCSADGLLAGQWGQETDLPVEELEKKMKDL